ncbi:MAG: hypothetical protein K6E75_04535 [Lachnospiraceae bacterium]|nr:hypothetical protein [Lachnospiraceae bacterium]
MMSTDRFPTRALSSVLWGICVMLWAITIRQRIIQKKIRKYILISCFLFVSLFAFRMICYALPDELYRPAEIFKVGYYLSMVPVPMCLLLSALSIGREEQDKIPGAKSLYLASGILSLLIATNPLHHSLLRYEKESIKIQSHGWLYWIFVVWLVCLMIGSVVVMVRRCQLMHIKKHWWIPIVNSLFPMALLVIYLINGGSPFLFGVKLYLFQEAYCLLYIVFWESCIQIGFIPSNSDYPEIFRASSIKAFLTDQKGETVYRSGMDCRDLEAYKEKAQEGEVLLPGFLRLQSRKVTGGQLFWVDDVVNVKQISESLLEAVNLISEENTLIAEEQRLREMQTRVSIQNRLYDEIAFRVHRQLAGISALLQQSAADRETRVENLKEMAIQGVYVKRLSNLILIAEENERIKIEELVYALEESMEYMTLAGIGCRVNYYKDQETSAQTVISAYSFFQKLIEAFYPGFSFFYVTLEKKEFFEMRFMLDLSEQDVSGIEFEEPGITLSFEEDTVYIRWKEADR